MTPAILIVLLAVLAVSVVFDLRYRRIPNSITLTSTAAFLVFASLGGAGLMSGFGLAVGLGVGMLGFYSGFWGGGDGKLVMAIGAALGPGGVLYAILYSVACGAVLGLYGVLANGGHRTALGRLIIARNRMRTGSFESDGMRGIPYGVAIACGTVLSLYISL